MRIPCPAAADLGEADLYNVTRVTRRFLLASLLALGAPFRAAAWSRRARGGSFA